MPPAIIFEDNHLLALYKPAGWLVQGDRTGDPTLTDWGKAYLKEKYQKPGAVFLHPAHRLDRPVSGVILFARTDKALGRITELFRRREVQKTYLALVMRPPKADAGELHHWLLKDEQRNVTQTFDRPNGDAKACVLTYELLGPAGAYFLLRVRPVTGRSHQIRAQLSAVGCIIAGDLKYGAPLPWPDASIGLHSRSMAFIHPVRKEPLEIVAELPALTEWDAARLLV